MSNFNRGMPGQQPCVDIEMTVLESMLYEIWECAKAGYEAAKAFMKSDLRIEYVNMELSFNDGKAIAFERYRKIKSAMENVIRRCIHEKSLHQEVLHD
ncbi:hypothetical protein MKC49_20290 [[Clostridium] innocuum]|nr:hypothetical protein [[Clostridium] innocuum]MCR0469923.1 hypothetical protein [[Clostridium] innocuum]MCR0478396.1 hypothetical protein [[Clostridium] innocuum]